MDGAVVCRSVEVNQVVWTAGTFPEGAEGHCIGVRGERVRLSPKSFFFTTEKSQDLSTFTVRCVWSISRVPRIVVFQGSKIVNIALTAEGISIGKISRIGWVLLITDNKTGFLRLPYEIKS